MKVWTFIILGGEPFRLALQDRIGPPLEHTGERTIWKMVGTEAEAQSVEQMLTGPVIRARVTRTTEEQSEEQARLRLSGEE